MSLNEILNEFVIFGVFLLAGFLLRQYVKPLQKLFIPSSVIGGLLALIMGQQVLGIIEVPASFSAYSGAMMRIVMACVVFGISINKEKVSSYGDFMACMLSMYGWQVALGLGLGAVLKKIWPSLPNGWGFQAVSSFYGGHGTAGTVGASFEEVGIMGVRDLGMVLSTIGLICGMLCGMIVVNIGVRRGWATFVKQASVKSDSFYGGILPKDEQTPIGYKKTTGMAINSLALQFCFILLSMWIGKWIFTAATLVVPGMSRIPELCHSVVGAMVTWPLLKLLKLDGYCDKATISQISGLALEVLILGAMATLNLQFLAKFIIPILIMSVIFIILVVFYSLWITRTSCRHEWFEKSLYMIGCCLGAAPTGLALVRTVDPNGESSVPEAHGIYSGFTFWVGIVAAMVPMYLKDGSIVMVAGFGLTIFVVAISVALFVFAKRKQA